MSYHDLRARNPKVSSPKKDEMVLIKTVAIPECKDQQRYMFAKCIELYSGCEVVFEDKYSQWHGIKDVICWYELLKTGDS